MPKEVMVLTGCLGFSVQALVASLLSALDVTPGKDGAVLSVEQSMSHTGSVIYVTTTWIETHTLTGVAGVVLHVHLVSEQLEAPVDPQETLTVTVGAERPERLAAAVEVLRRKGLSPAQQRTPAPS